VEWDAQEKMAMALRHGGEDEVETVAGVVVVVTARIVPIERWHRRETRAKLRLTSLQVRLES
jgi:hypothetical protein